MISFYTLTLTNLEVQRMFSRMIKDWFAQTGGLSGFVRAMSEGNVESMEEHLAELMLNSMSSFDDEAVSIKLPENFYRVLAHRGSWRITLWNTC